MAEGRSETPSHAWPSPGQQVALVHSVFANAVFVYSLPELKLLGHVVLPDLSFPDALPIGALPNWRLSRPTAGFSTSHSAIRSVSAIDTKAMKVVANIPVGEVPKRINTAALR